MLVRIQSSALQNARRRPSPAPSFLTWRVALPQPSHHPAGCFRTPHTAVIPSNRKRIVNEISTLVREHWLPPSLLKGKVEAFDFVTDGLLPALPALRRRLPKLVRDAARHVLEDLSPAALAEFLGRG